MCTPVPIQCKLVLKGETLRRCSTQWLSGQGTHTPTPHVGEIHVQSTSSKEGLKWPKLLTNSELVAMPWELQIHHHPYLDLQY